MSHSEAAEVLKWANDNYEEGGHWIVETMSEAEIIANFSTLEDAKEYCSLIQGRYEDVRGLGDCDAEEANSRNSLFYD